MPSAAKMRLGLIYLGMVVIGVSAGVASGTSFRKWQRDTAARAKTQEVNDFLAKSMSGIAIGTRFPDVPLWTPDGAKAATVVDVLPDGGVVYYIVLGCESCLEAVSNLQNAGGIAQSSAGRILVIASGIPTEAQEFIGKSGFAGLLMVDATNSLSIDYGVRAFPAYFCLDNQQRVVSFGAEVRTVSQLGDVLANCGKEAEQ